MCSQIRVLWAVSFLECCNINIIAPQFFCYYCCSSLKVVWIVLKGSDIPCCNVHTCLAFIVSLCSKSWSTAKLDNQLAAVTSKFKWSELSLGILPLPFRGKQCCPVVGCFVTRAGYTMNRHSKSRSKRPSDPSRLRGGSWLKASSSILHLPPSSFIPRRRASRDKKLAQKLRSNGVVPVCPTLFPLPVDIVYCRYVAATCSWWTHALQLARIPFLCGLPSSLVATAVAVHVPSPIGFCCWLLSHLYDINGFAWFCGAYQPASHRMAKTGHLCTFCRS